MGTLLIGNGDGQGYIPLAGPAVDGEGPVGNAVRMRRLAEAGIPADLFAHVEPAENETVSEARERIRRLQEAKQRSAERFRCPGCGKPGAKWAHESYPELCKPTPRCPECGAEFPYQVPRECPLCGTAIYIEKGQP